MKLLSDDQIVEFYREGYIVVRNLVPESAMDAVLAESQTVAVPTGGKWTSKIWDFEHPEQDARLHQLLIEPNIVGVVEQILEAPARVYYGMLAVVPAHGGNGLAWHQDNMYDLIQGRALNTFVALCDITPEKALLWVAPGSHHKGVQESRTEDGHRIATTPPNGIQLPALQKGDAVLFDRNTLHHSKKNNTDEDRYAYAAQYMEEKSRRSDGTQDPLKLRVTDLYNLWHGSL